MTAYDKQYFKVMIAVEEKEVLTSSSDKKLWDIELGDLRQMVRINCNVANRA